MYRKFDDQLIAWKQKNNHLPLLTSGRTVSLLEKDTASQTLRKQIMSM